MTRYTATDIQKYLDGELSGPEMNALEKAALEDPFLADAIEGIGNARALRGDVSLKHELADLNKRLENRTNKKNMRTPIVFFRSGWRVAAAVILLAGLATISYRYLVSSKENAPLAVMDQKAAHSDSNAAQADTSRSLVKPATVPSAESEAVAAKDAPAGALSAPARARLPKTAPLRRNLPATARAEDSEGMKIDKLRNAFYANGRRQELDSLRLYADLEKKVGSRDFGVYNKDSAGLNPKARLLAKSSDAGAGAYGNLPVGGGSNYNFSGKVLDQHNRPLPGVSLTLVDHPGFATVSDNNGIFKLNVRQQDSAYRLMANYAGYEPTVISMSTENASSNIIYLQPEATKSLNEVVVTRLGSQLRLDPASRKRMGEADKEKTAEEAMGSAVPVKGWQEYETWLKKNKGTVVTGLKGSDGSDSTLRGDEIISFNVDKKGALSSFKIEQSLSPAHDSSFIRLIRQGPAWRPLKGKKGRAVVTVSY
ncbi:MAG TPA: carboxypeptidase-like regulatory domain-containing protein [Puia sp.]|nr:carboxypeptidase-like regulatory domain-containing protein [Puia sp.]